MTDAVLVQLQSALWRYGMYGVEAAAYLLAYAAPDVVHLGFAASTPTFDHRLALSKCLSSGTAKTGHSPFPLVEVSQKPKKMELQNGLLEKSHQSRCHQ